MTTEISVYGKIFILNRKLLDSSQKRMIAQILSVDFAAKRTLSEIIDNISRIEDRTTIDGATTTIIQTKGSVFDKNGGHTGSINKPVRLNDVGDEARVCPNGLKKGIQTFEKAPIIVRKID